MKTPREVLEFRAYQLYEINPEWGRRKVAKTLRDEYGSALRDAELDKIRKSTFSYKAREEQIQTEEYRAMQLFSSQPKISLIAVQKTMRADFIKPIAGLTTIKRYREASIMNEAMLDAVRKARGNIVKPQPKIYTARPRIHAQELPDVPQSLYRERAMLLRSEGFQKWEWQWLAFHDIETKAMVRMRYDRRQEYRRWENNLQLSDYDIEGKILDRYKKEAWFFNDGRFNPFKMIDQYYKTDDDGQPTDKTPSTKRRGGKTDFVEAAKKTANRKNRWRYGV